MYPARGPEASRRGHVDALVAAGGRHRAGVSSGGRQGYGRSAINSATGLRTPV
jgi:hypothetical protein